MARGVAISRVGRRLRRPYYWCWEQLRRRAYDGRSYTIAVPWGQRVYTPWFADPAASEIAAAIASVRSHGPMAVAPDRCGVLFHYAREAARKHPGAPMAECGVYTGGTAELIALVIAGSGAADRTALHLFDSFAGMPESSDPSTDYHAPGDFGDASETVVRRRLERFSFASFHVGFMPETFQAITGETGFSFVHVDVDIYGSARDCIAELWPRMASGGVMIFDDYGFYPYRNAAKRAVDEAFAVLPERPMALPTGQAVVVKD